MERPTPPEIRIIEKKMPTVVKIVIALSSVMAGFSLLKLVSILFNF